MLRYQLLALCLACACLFSSVTPAHAQKKAKTYNLTTGPGDGSVTVPVDGTGQIGYGGLTNFGFDPIGPTGVKNTQIQSLLSMRVGTTGKRPTLVGTNVKITTQTATQLTSTFDVGTLGFLLDQTVVPRPDAGLGVDNGIILTQTYTITNNDTNPVDFDFVRWIHPHSGGTSLGGGNLGTTTIQGVNAQWLYLVDKKNSASTLPVYMSAEGGSVLVSDRLEISLYPSLASISVNSGTVYAGTPLSGTVLGDNNSDGLVDAGKESHLTMALRNEYLAVAPGANVIYTVVTIFGDDAAKPPSTGVTVQESDDDTSVVKGGTVTDTYDVYLETPPTKNVTVTLAFNSSQLTVSPKTLTFTPANWDTAQTVTVSAIQDHVLTPGGLSFGTITHTATSTDPLYNNVTIDSLLVLIYDAPYVVELPGGPGEGNYFNSGGPRPPDVLRSPIATEGVVINTQAISYEGAYLLGPGSIKPSSEPRMAGPIPGTSPGHIYVFAVPPGKRVISTTDNETSSATLAIVGFLTLAVAGGVVLYVRS